MSAESQMLWQNIQTTPEETHAHNKYIMSMHFSWSCLNMTVCIFYVISDRQVSEKNAYLRILMYSYCTKQATGNTFTMKNTH